MTEQNPMPPDDHELEQFLSRRSELSQLHRADTAGEGAPPELDALVLAQARAVLQRPPLRSRRLQRWGRPLAVAATLVLVVSLGWMAQQKPLPQQMAFTPAAPAVPTETAAPAVDTAAAPPAAKAEEVKKQTIAGQAPAGAAQRRQSAAAARSVEDRLAQPQTQPVQQYGSAAAAEPPPPSPPPPPLPAAALTAKAAAPVPFAPAPTPLGMTTPVTVAPAASLAAAPNPCAALPSRAAAQDQAAGSGAVADWLERIRRLRDASDLAGARAELACFSYLHTPGEVPDDLKVLLSGVP